MKTAVFLMNLGGPRTVPDVEPFLYELFADPEMVPVPFGPLRKPFAKLISVTRASSSGEKYQLIGGGSPLIPAAEEQARMLAETLGPDFVVYPSMRCGPPRIRERVTEALAAGAERAVGLPMDPQFSTATTGSQLTELRRRWPGEKPLVEVLRYATHPDYLAAVEERVREAFSSLPAEHRKAALVVFSAHGLPLRQVKKGDPYPEEIAATAAEVARRLGLPHQVCFQSRVGPLKWLGPDTTEWLEANVKGRAVIAVPLPFTAENLETLYDLDILARGACEKGGAVAFARAKTPGGTAGLIAAMAAAVRGALERAS